MAETKRMTVDEYLAELEKRFGKDKDNWKVVCPACKTEQTVKDFKDAGVVDISSYWGFSCIGRFTNEEKGCDWTLGGFLQIHTLELVNAEGKVHPRMEIANN